MRKLVTAVNGTARVAALSGEAPGLPLSLFEGVEAATCEILGIASLRHRSALHALGRSDQLPRGSVAAALDRIAANWKACAEAGQGSVSQQNWRWWEPQSFIGAANRSPEVILERAIVNACVAAGRRDWSNQIPVASGVVGPSGEKRRAIDLVQKIGEGHFAFIELKVASDTPLYAAFEIISYVGVWLQSRSGARQTDLLSATCIDARVLAPSEYYARYELGALEPLLDEELKAYGARHGVKLSFGFETLPQSFTPLQKYTDAEIFALLGGRQPL